MRGTRAQTCVRAAWRRRARSLRESGEARGVGTSADPDQRSWGVLSSDCSSKGRRRYRPRAEAERGEVSANPRPDLAEGAGKREGRRLGGTRGRDEAGGGGTWEGLRGGDPRET